MFVGVGGGFLQVAWGAYDGEVGLCELLGHECFLPSVLLWGCWGFQEYFSSPKGCLKYTVVLR